MFLNAKRRGGELGVQVSRVMVGAPCDDVNRYVFLTGVDVCQTSLSSQSSQAVHQLIHLSQWSRDECQEFT